jgi:hypothetical protein
MTMQTHVAVSAESVHEESAQNLWERAFPGRGRAIMDVLGPCYDSPVTIGPPIPGPSMRGEGVLEVARDVYHWLVEQNGLFGRIIEQRYLSRFRDADPSEFQWLDTLLAKRYGMHDRYPIPRACLQAMHPDNLDAFEHLRDRLPPAFRVRLWESYTSAVKTGLAYAVRGSFPEEAAYFRRLIRVWHNGCPPVGYGTTNRGGQAVVFIAEDRPFP